MATAKRIYRVDSTPGDAGESQVEESFLVRATTPAHAIRHLARHWTAHVATQDDVAELAGAGVRVQEAGEE